MAFGKREFRVKEMVTPDREVWKEGGREISEWAENGRGSGRIPEWA